MKKLIFILCLLSSVCFGQTVPTAQLTFSTLNDLRSQGAQMDGAIGTLIGLTTVTDGNGGQYQWRASSTATDDGFVTVKVANITTGRWVRIGNGNTIKGSVQTSGVSLQTSYTVNYQGGALPFVPITVIVNPRSSAAAERSWISSITNTGFTINFLTIPILGTNNIQFDYIVVKQ